MRLLSPEHQRRGSQTVKRSFSTLMLVFFFFNQSIAMGDSNELRGTSAVRSQVMKLVQERTNKELRTETELTVKSWTNTNDHILVIAKPQVSMFRDRIVFVLLKKDTRPKQSPTWKIVNYKVAGMSQNPLKIWEKKYKILPKDMFMLAQIAIQVDD